MAVNAERGFSGGDLAETRPEDSSAESEWTLAIAVSNRPLGVGTIEATSLEAPDHPAAQESKLSVHIHIYGGASEGMALLAFQISTKIPQ